MSMKQVILTEDISAAPETWEHYEVEDIRDFLMKRFTSWPGTARIYHEQVAESCDVTPSDEWGIERLGQLEGKFYVIVYPGDPVTIIIAVVAVAAAVAAAYFFRPSIPKMNGQKQKSSNNSLSDRTNRERINGRIPDIYGQLRSIPDLLSVPYKIFDHHEEIEYALMCIGRGHYLCEDIRDSDTLVRNIRGSSVEIYPPNTPLYGEFTMTLNIWGANISFNFPVPGSPEIRIGNPIYEPLLFPKRCDSVVGQVLRPENDQNYTGNATFIAPNTIQVPDGNDLVELFANGDPITVAGAQYDTPVTANYTARFKAGGTILFATGTDLSAFNVGESITIAGATFQHGVDSSNCNGTFPIIEVGSNFIKVSGVGNNDFGAWSWIADWYFRENGYATPYKAVSITAPGSTAINLDGDYQILVVDPTEIVLDDPASVNPQWNTLSQFANSTSPPLSVILASEGPKYIGPFVVDFPNFRYLYANFVATNGLYSVDENGNEYKIDVVLALEVQRLNPDDSPWGAPETFQVTLEGSKTKKQRGVTLRCTPSWAATGEHAGRCSVRAYRVTPELSSDGDTYVQEVQWRDLYALCKFPANTGLGDVTIVRSQTRGTLGALALKEHQLNLLVTRKLPHWDSNTLTWNTDPLNPDPALLLPTKRADDIIAAMCLDPYIGGRALIEVDLPNIYATVQEVINYFTSNGRPQNIVCGEFSYTFDDADVSFEESLAAVADAIFCIAYRRGSQIRIKFEKPQTDSMLLFNHRNKLPGTEIRTIRFGTKDDRDGVEYEYISPLDDSPQIFYIPEDRSAKNPSRIESVGIRSRIQAFYHAYRIWNKMRYQRVTVEFEATQEAELALVYDRILVADNTRADTLDGDVLEQNGLELTLSRDVPLD